MSIHRTHGVVLRTHRLRESSKIVVFFTRDFGKLSIVAKGSLKPKSKFGASLELFTRSAIIFYRKENRELHTLSHSEVLSAYEGLQKDVVKVAYTSVVGEMLEKLLPSEEANRDIYLLLTEVLDEIDLAERSQLEVILSAYWFKLLRLVGYGPQVGQCVRCGRKVSDRAWFGLISGGLLCVDCRSRDLNSIQLSKGALDLLREYDKQPIRYLRQKYGFGEQVREVADLLETFLHVQVSESTKIKSLEFLERIRNGLFQ